jgi:hypothetical protein
MVVSPLTGDDLVTVNFADHNIGSPTSFVQDFGDGTSHSGASVVSHDYGPGVWRPVVSATAGGVTDVVQCAEVVVTDTTPLTTYDVPEPIEYYRFNRFSGDVWEGARHSKNLTGHATPYTGVGFGGVGTCAECAYPEGQSYLQLDAYDAAFTPGDADFGVSCFFQILQSPLIYYRTYTIASCWDTGDASLRCWTLQVRGVDGVLEWRVHDGTSEAVVEYPTPINPWEPHWVYAEHDAAADELRLYVDDPTTPVATVSHSTGVRTAAAKLTLMATQDLPYDHWLFGRVGNLFVTGALLNEGARTALYGAGTPPRYAQLAFPPPPPPPPLPFTPADAGSEDYMMVADPAWMFTSIDESGSPADGDTVGSFVDATGTGGLVVQSLAGARGTYKTAVINGRDVLRLDAAKTYTLPTTDNTTKTLHFLLRKRSTSGGGTVLGYPFQLYYHDDGGGQAGWWFYPGPGFGEVFLVAADPTDWQVLTLRMVSDSLIELYVNGTLAGSVDPFVGMEGVTSFVLGNGDFDYAVVLFYAIAQSAPHVATDAASMLALVGL